MPDSGPHVGCLILWTVLVIEVLVSALLLGLSLSDCSETDEASGMEIRRGWCRREWIQISPGLEVSDARCGKHSGPQLALRDSSVL